MASVILMRTSLYVDLFSRVIAYVETALRAHPFKISHFNTDLKRARNFYARMHKVATRIGVW